MSEPRRARAEGCTGTRVYVDTDVMRTRPSKSRWGETAGDKRPLEQDCSAISWQAVW